MFAEQLASCGAAQEEGNWPDVVRLHSVDFWFCAQRRREYMERDSIRSDSKLFIGLFVAFVAPAVGILAWAYFSGYLDQLAQGYKRF